jgi:transposase
VQSGDAMGTRAKLALGRHAVGDTTAMKRLQGYRLRSEPTTAEEALPRQFLGCSRFLWNAILAENETRYSMGDPFPLSYSAFCDRLLVLKKRHDFLRSAHSQPLQQTLRDLSRAYENAFNPKLAACGDSQEPAKQEALRAA